MNFCHFTILLINKNKNIYSRTAKDHCVSLVTIRYIGVVSYSMFFLNKFKFKLNNNKKAYVCEVFIGQYSHRNAITYIKYTKKTQHTNSLPTL